MFKNILSENFSAYHYYDDVQIYSDNILEAIASYDMYTSELISEHMIFVGDIKEIIIESIINNDLKTVVFLNEGVIGSAIGLVKKIVGTAYVFMRKLLGKINVFVDQYTASNTQWYNRYASKVKAKAGTARGFTYEGHKWNMNYMTAKPYPDITPELQKQSDIIARAAKDYTSLLTRNDTKAEDFKSIEESLQDIFPDGFRNEAKSKYEEILKCKVEDITNYYYKEGSGVEASIAGFKHISIDGMLNHIATSSDLIIEVNNIMDKTLEKINKIVDAVDKIDVDDFETKIAKKQNPSTNNETVSVLNEGSFFKKKNKNPTASDSTKEKDDFSDSGSIKKTGDTAGDDAEKEEKASEDNQNNNGNDSSDDTVNSASEYTKTLRNVLSDSIITWNMTLSITNKLAGVRISLIKDANREFIKVLTKFMGAKEGA